MKTNANQLAVALLVAALTVSFAHAQTQSGSSNPATAQKPEPPKPDLAKAGAPPKKPGDRPGGPGREHGPGHKPAPGLTTLTSLSGTVGQWISNDDAILDGFTLSTGTGTTTVKFPPHLGQQVQKAVQLGSSVSVSGYAETSPKNESRFRMNSLTAGKTTLVDTPPSSKQTTTTDPALTTVNGKIADFRLNHDGKVSGLVLDDKTIVSIPPHVASQLSELAKKGSAITVQGYPKTLHDGQVQLEKVNILRASVLTINGQQYLVR